MSKKLFWAATALALTASVSVISAAPAIAKEKAAKVMGADVVIPAPPEGQGQIVFYRNGGAGGAMGCSIHEGGEKVSSLGANRYFVMVAEPGRHEFSVKSEATDTLALEVEADETQFVACKIKMGIMVGRPDIRPSDEGEFRKSKSLRMVDADDMGPAPGALRPEDFAAK